MDKQLKSTYTRFGRYYETFNALEHELKSKKSDFKSINALIVGPGRSDNIRDKHFTKTFQAYELVNILNNLDYKYEATIIDYNEEVLSEFRTSEVVLAIPVNTFEKSGIKYCEQFFPKHTITMVNNNFPGMRYVKFPQPKFTLIKEDIFNTTLPKEKYNLILSTMVAWHYTNGELITEKLADSLVPEGFLMTSEQERVTFDWRTCAEFNPHYGTNQKLFQKPK